MKNLITKAAVAVSLAGLVSTTSFAANNAITLTAEIGVVTVVGFADVSAETLNDTFVNATPDLDFGLVAAGTDFTAITTPIFVRHNDTATNAQITFTDAANGGNLKHSALAEVIPVTYTILGNAITLGTPVELLAAGTVNAGSVSLGDFVATPTAGGTAGKSTGIYSTTLTVTVSGV